MKSTMRALENATNLAREIAGDGDTDPQKLADYARDLRVTGVIVLDADGRVVSEYTADGVGSAQLADELSLGALLDVAQNGSKVYGSAVTLPDGGRVDVDAACREDAPGIVVSLYHTSADFANRYTLTLQNLLSGYSTEDNGTVVIEQGARVVASNDESVAAGSGSEVLGSLKRRCAAHKLTFFRSGGQDYLGTLAHARDYYVYIYTPRPRSPAARSSQARRPSRSTSPRSPAWLLRAGAWSTASWSRPSSRSTSTTRSSRVLPRRLRTRTRRRPSSCGG